MRKSKKRIVALILSVFLIWGVWELARYYGVHGVGIFSQRNCSNFVMHVATLMKKYNNPHPINRTGSREQLYSMCTDTPLSYEQIDCSMNTEDLDEVQRCIQ